MNKEEYYKNKAINSRLSEEYKIEAIAIDDVVFTTQTAIDKMSSLMARIEKDDRFTSIATKDQTLQYVRCLKRTLIESCEGSYL